jgi:hypothetical protein
VADRIHVPARPAGQVEHRHEVTFALPAPSLAAAAERGMPLAEAYFAPTRRPRLIGSTARPVLTSNAGAVVLDSEGRLASRWIIELTYLGELPPPERT